MSGIRRTQITPCAKCGKGVGHSGGPDVYRVTIEQHLLDNQAIQQHAGMDLMFGNQHPALSVAMLGDSEITKQVSTTTRLVCRDCFMDFNTSIAEVWCPE